MTQYATVTTTTNLNAQFFESADPTDLQNQINAYIASLDISTVAISAIVLSGGGDGHAFQVEVQTAPFASGAGSAVGSGGLPSGAGGGIQGTVVRCFLASSPEELVPARIAAGVPATIVVGPSTVSYGLRDEQMAGASKGQRFMGLSVYVINSVPGQGASLSPYALVVGTGLPLVLAAGDTLVTFVDDQLYRFSLPATTRLLYLGGENLIYKMEASITVGLTAGGSVTVDIVSDPSGAPSVIGTTTTTVAAGEFDNVSVLGITAVLPTAISTTGDRFGVRVTAPGAGSVISASFRATPL